MIQSRHNLCRAATGFVLTTILFTSFGMVFGQTDQSRKPLSFRRVYVDEQTTEKWPRYGYRYAPPIQQEEFERLIKLFDVSGEAAQQQDASLVSARYQAQLKNGTLVGGTAVLRFRHAAEGPVVVPLGECQIPVLQPGWTADSNKPASRKAVVGLTEDGQLAALVSRGEYLRFDWSLRSKLEENQAELFEIEFPAATTGMLELLLPVGMTPTTNGAVVKGPMNSDKPEWKLWEISLGGDGKLSLRLSTKRKQQPTPQRMIMREFIRYDISDRGVAVGGEWSLDVGSQAIDKLEITYPSTFRISTARWREHKLRVVPLTGSKKMARAVLHFPSGFVGEGQVLLIDGYTPTLTATPQTLPRLRFKSVAWERGSAEVIVRHPMVLHSWNILGGEGGVADVRDVQGLQEGQRSLFHFFNENTSLQTLVERETDRVLVSNGTSLRLDENVWSARQIIHLRAERGERFRLAGAIQPGWTIESVEELIQETDNEQAPRVYQSNIENDRVDILLRQSIAKGRDLWLEVVAVAQRPQVKRNEVLTSFNPLSIDNGVRQRAVVGVGTELSQQFEIISGDRRDQLDPQNLDQYDEQLLGGDRHVLSFVQGEGPQPWELRVKRQSASFRVDIQTSVAISAEELNEQYDFSVSNLTGALTQLEVHLSAKRSTALDWKIAGDDKTVVTARLIPSSAQNNGNADGSDETKPQSTIEIWELSFSSPLDGPFHLQASRRSKASSARRVSLAAVTGATQQRGTAAIHITGDDIVRVNTRNVRTIPPANAARDRFSTLRGAFRYDPPGAGWNNDRGPLLGFTLQAATEAQSSAWIWSCKLTSWYNLHGIATHQLVYRIENAGKESFDLTIPSEMLLQRVVVDGKRLSVSNSSHMRIPLPANVRFPVVRVEFDTKSTEMRTFDTLSSSLTTTDLPVLDSHWDVWLAPGVLPRQQGSDWLDMSATTPHWSQRLCGPFRGRIGGAPFRVTSRDDWTNLLSGWWDSSPIPPEAQSVLQYLQRERPTLKSRLDGYLSGLERNGQPLAKLYIDDLALSEAGMSATKQLALLNQVAPNEQAPPVLTRFGLALAVADDRVLLTSIASVARFGRNARPTSEPGVFRVEKGPLFEKIRHAELSTSTLTRVEAWRRRPAQQTPWLEGASDEPPTLVGTDWTFHRRTLLPGKTPQLPVYRASVIDSAGCALFLVTLGFGLWYLRGRPKHLVIATSAACLIALWLPVYLLAMATGVCLGFLSCILVNTFWIDSTHQVVHAEQSSDALASGWSWWGRLGFHGLWIWVLCCATLVWGQEAEKPIAPKKHVYPILIPTDDTQKPTGYYYLPADFLATLRSRAENQEATSRWLLRRAKYAGTLERANRLADLKVSELIATYEFDILAATTRVRIPLVHRNVDLVEDGATLQNLDDDDSTLQRIVQPEWLPGDRQLRLPALEAGRYSLRLKLRPTSLKLTQTRGIELEIPALADSQLTLTVPEQAPEIDLPLCQGDVQLVKSKQEDATITQILKATLGPTGRLSLRWESGQATNQDAAKVAVDEAIRLGVNPPDGYRVDVRYQYTIEGSTKQLYLETDPRLELINIETDQPSQSRKMPPDGIWQPYQIDLDREATGQVVVRASFKMKQKRADQSSLRSLVGKIHIPRIRPRGQRAANVVVGVTVASPLRLVGAPMDFDSSRFARLWGDPEAIVDLDFDIATRELDKWSFSTRPQEVRMTATSKIVLQVESESVNVHLTADLETFQGDQFQYQVTLPSELEVAKVELVGSDAKPRPARYTRAQQSKMLTVFLSKPATKQTLLIHGSLPIPANKRVQVPSFLFDQMEAVLQTVHIQRSPSMWVEIDPKDAPLHRRAATTAATNNRYRHVGIQQRMTGDEPLILICKPNELLVEATQYTSLRREENAWAADVDVTFLVKKGGLDQLQFEIPAYWNDQLEIEMGAESRKLELDRDYELIPIPGLERRLLVLRPPQAITNEYQVHLRAPRAVASDEQVSVPRVTVLGVNDVTHFVFLPAQFEWNAPKLIRTSSEQSSGEQFVRYQVPKNVVEFQAELKAVRHEGKAIVRLADIQVAWRSKGATFGVVEFDIEPGSLRKCTIVLPEQVEIIHATMGGIPASLTSAGSRRWNINLGTDRLPKHIEIVFRGQLKEPPTVLTRDIYVPWITGVDVEKTLWTIHSPDGRGLGSPTDDASSVNASQQALQRLEATSSSVDLPKYVRAESSREDIERWYIPWERRWRGDYHQAIRLGRESSNQDLINSAETLDEEIERVAAGLDTTSTRLQVGDEEALADQASELIRSTSHERTFATYASLSRASEQIQVRNRLSTTDDRLQRFAVSLLVVLVATTFWFAERSERSLWPIRSPQLIGVLLGLAWWLWLTPSFLGWIIVLVSLASCLPKWKAVA